MAAKKEFNVFCELSNLQRNLYSYFINKKTLELQNTHSDHDDIAYHLRKWQTCDHKEDSADDSDNSNVEDDLSAERAEPSAQEIEKCVAPYMIGLLSTQGTMIIFKKIVDHPYLVQFPVDPSHNAGRRLINEDLILSSGKMMVLNLMLYKLKEQGHKILIFSTLVMTLDFIEHYMILRNHNYRRLDMCYSLEVRRNSVTDFNNDPNVLAVLLSTRIGGFGLNFAGADTIIFFDRDWDPQLDIQAQDRCHPGRLGLTKPIMVYNLVAKKTIDEEIACGQHKWFLEKIVAVDGEFTTLNHADRKRFRKILEREKRMQGKAHSCLEISELDQLLDRSDL